MSTQVAQQQTSTPSKTTEIRIGEFHGALSRFQVGAFNDLLGAKVPHKIAHKIATDFGSDLGRLMSTDAEFRAKVGKADKNGNSRIALSGGAKITSSRAMSTVRVAQQVDNLYMEGLLASRSLPEMSKTLREYYTDCETWAGLQIWADKN